MRVIALLTFLWLHLMVETLPALLSSDGQALGATIPILAAFKRPRGRPRKFSAPSHAVTLTLPESVITSLSPLEADLSRAVVELSQHKGLQRKQVSAPSCSPAEVVVFRDEAVITVRLTSSLERQTGAHLVPLPDGRALISFDSPQTVADLELTIDDSLDDPKLSPEDREVFEAIDAILKDDRRSKTHYPAASQHHRIGIQRRRRQASRDEVDSLSKRIISCV